MLMIALKGMAAGALCSLPLGPAGMLCVQRTLSAGQRAGIASAMGIVIAHTLWCLVAVGHWERVGAGLATLERPIQLGLGTLLLALGLRACWLARRGVAIPAGAGSAARGFAPTFALVGINPATLMTVLAAVWMVGLNLRGAGPTVGLGAAASVFIGGALTWLLLTGLCARLGARVGDVALARVQLGLGIVLTGLGVGNLVAAASRLL
ncbi:MAG: hypothetical protein IPM17_08040 [Verrucomicrobia bacterium]|jgi:threonine/homoserine/homoserine lactone efflux protein|nr:hypothetical protein [Verrucomicrobiota bacterium]